MSEAWPDTYDERYIHQFQPEPTYKFTSSSTSTDFKNILPWNFSQIIRKTVPSGMRIVISHVMKWGTPLWVWKVNGNWDNNMIGISQSRENHCRTNMSVRRTEISKRAGLWKLQSGIQVRKLTMSKIVWDRKIITEFTRSICSTRTGRQSLWWMLKVSKDKHISRWVDWENLIYVRWNRIKNYA